MTEPVKTPESAIQPVAQWLEQPIFISSTFRDMQAERDVLHDTVFPELKKRLATYHRTLAPVDLRNGVETVGVEKPEEKELQVLSVCLDEIKRCKPFLLVILGERYGWVPDRKRMDDAVVNRRDPELTGIKLDDKSVTALEIEYGALASKEQRKRSLFCFRDLKDAEKIPDAEKEVYDDRRSQDPKVASRHARLVALKEDIRNRKEFEGKIVDYAPRYDAKLRRVVDLEKWADEVTTALWKDLEADCIIHEKEMRAKDAHYDSWQSAERRTIEEFLENRRVGFVGRQEEIDAAVAFLLGKTVNPKQGLCLTGEAGAGKSALFAKIHEQLEIAMQNGKIYLLAHAAGISNRAGSVDAIVSRWIQELGAFLGYAEYDPAAGITEFEKKKELFYNLLYSASQKRPVVCAIDSLDSLDPSHEALTMNWLPDALHAGARFLATAIPGKSSEVLGRKPWCELRPIAPFVEKNGSDKNARDFVAAQCARLHKNPLNKAVVDALVALVNNNTGLPACANPLWLSIAVNRLLHLDADDHTGIAQIDSETSADKKILAYQINKAKKTPGSVENIYDDLFDYCARQFGSRVNIPWIATMLDYIACSRRGLRESDLEGLLVSGDSSNGEPLNEAKREFSRQFAMVRNYLAGHLVQRSELGLWDFVHGQGRRSRLDGHYADDKAMARVGENLNNPAYTKKTHREIANHLEHLDEADGLRTQEIMWHYFKGDEKEKAGRYYGKRDALFVPGELKNATGTLVEEIVRCEKAGGASNYALVWIEAVIAGCVNDEDKWRWCNKLDFHLHDVLVNEGVVTTRLRLVEIAMRGQVELRKRDLDSADFARDLSISYEKLGSIQLQLGNPPEALRYYQQQNAIAEELRKRAPDSAGFARDLAISYEKLGSIQLQLGNSPEALRYYQQALVIAEELRKRAPDSADFARNLSISYERLGGLQLQLGNSPEALRYYQQCFTIREELRKRTPDSVDFARDLSVSYNLLGDLQLKLGNPSEALRYYQQQNAIAEELRKRAPDSAGFARDLSVSYNLLGNLQLQLGNPPEALRYYQQQNAIAEELRKRDMDSADFARGLSVSYVMLGDIQLQLGNLPEALRYYQQCLTIREELRKRDPDSADFARDLLISCERLGNLQLQLGNPPEALRYYQQQNAIAEELRKRALDSADFALCLSISYEKLGDIQRLLGNPPEALRYYQQQNAIAEELRKWDPDSADFARVLAVSYYKLASFCGQQNKHQDAWQYWALCKNAILYMKQRKMFVDSQGGLVLQYIEGLGI